MPATRKPDPEPQGTCIAPDCKGAVYCRGLCCACYTEANRAINRGETTEEKLVKKRLMNPPRRGQRNNNAMKKALSK